MRQKNVFGVAQNNPSAQSVAATSTIRPASWAVFYYVIRLTKIKFILYFV